jgi:hypothetical protein
MNSNVPGHRIAMWSGPRNISTAMMRSWGNRADTVVVDEPFYPFYLQTTRKDHPGAKEVIANGETDWRKVVETLTAPLPAGATAARGRSQRDFHRALVPGTRRPTAV